MMPQNRKYIVLTLILAVLLLVVVGVYLFWPMDTTANRPKKRKKLATLAQDTTSTLGKLTTGALSNMTTLANGAVVNISAVTSGVIRPTNETDIEFTEYSRDTQNYHQGIGQRDMFSLLIAPPPPPPPPRETLDVMTRNWVLWEISNDGVALIQDFRSQQHEVRAGELIDKVLIKSIEKDKNQVLVVNTKNPDESRTVSLMPISQMIGGWKLKGTVPGLKTAFIITGDNKSHKVKEGEVLQHVTVKQVLQNKVIMQYGSMSQELTP